MDAGKLTAVDLFGVDGASGRLGNFRIETWPNLKVSELRPIGFAPRLRGELESELILDVERLGAGRLVVGVERDLLDLGLCLAQ